MVILVGIDAMNWLAHVANHRSVALWRLHALHHSQEDMSVLTTFRTHPLVHATYLLALLPALVLGAKGQVPAGALSPTAAWSPCPMPTCAGRSGRSGRSSCPPPTTGSTTPAHRSTPRGTSTSDSSWWRGISWPGGPPSPGTGPGRTGISGRPVPLEQAASPVGIPGVVLSQLAQPFGVAPATDGAR